MASARILEPQPTNLKERIAALQASRDNASTPVPGMAVPPTTNLKAKIAKFERRGRVGGPGSSSRGGAPYSQSRSASMGLGIIPGAVGPPVRRVVSQMTGGSAHSNATADGDRSSSFDRPPSSASAYSSSSLARSPSYTAALEMARRAEASSPVPTPISPMHTGGSASFSPLSPLSPLLTGNSQKAWLTDMPPVSEPTDDASADPQKIAESPTALNGELPPADNSNLSRRSSVIIDSQNQLSTPLRRSGSMVESPSFTAQVQRIRTSYRGIAPPPSFVPPTNTTATSDSTAATVSATTSHGDHGRTPVASTSPAEEPLPSPPPVARKSGVSSYKVTVHRKESVDTRKPSLDASPHISAAKNVADATSPALAAANLSTRAAEPTGPRDQGTEAETARVIQATGELVSLVEDAAILELALAHVVGDKPSGDASSSARKSSASDVQATLVESTSTSTTAAVASSAATEADLRASGVDNESKTPRPSVDAVAGRSSVGDLDHQSKSVKRKRHFKDAERLTVGEPTSPPVLDEKTSIDIADYQVAALLEERLNVPSSPSISSSSTVRPVPDKAAKLSALEPVPMTASATTKTMPKGVPPAMRISTAELLEPPLVPGKDVPVRHPASASHSSLAEHTRGSTASYHSSSSGLRAFSFNLRRLASSMGGRSRTHTDSSGTSDDSAPPATPSAEGLPNEFGLSPHRVKSEYRERHGGIPWPSSLSPKKGGSIKNWRSAGGRRFNFVRALTLSTAKRGRAKSGVPSTNNQEQQGRPMLLPVFAFDDTVSLGFDSDDTVLVDRPSMSSVILPVSQSTDALHTPVKSTLGRLLETPKQIRRASWTTSNNSPTNPSSPTSPAFDFGLFPSVPNDPRAATLSSAPRTRSSMSLNPIPLQYTAGEAKLDIAF